MHLSRDLTNLLNVADKDAQKRGDQYIASELFLLACAADKGEIGRLLKQRGIDKKNPRKGGRAGPRRRKRFLRRRMKAKGRR